MAISIFLMGEISMWNYHDLSERERWWLEDIPPEIRLLVGELELACLAGEDGLLDRGTVLYLAETAADEWPEPETVAWVQKAIEANPGIWIARLCRAMHGKPETYQSIVWCGVCAQYANSRRRARAARLPDKTLPGLAEIGGAYQLHPPCSPRGLTWLRQQIYRLVAQGWIKKLREKCADLRQPRGWDFMSTLYPAKSNCSERKNQ
jgi:hypothetical protein